MARDSGLWTRDPGLGTRDDGLGTTDEGLGIRGRGTMYQGPWGHGATDSMCYGAGDSGLWTRCHWLGIVN